MSYEKEKIDYNGKTPFEVLEELDWEFIPFDDEESPMHTAIARNISPANQEVTVIVHWESAAMDFALAADSFDIEKYVDAKLPYLGSWDIPDTKEKLEEDAADIKAMLEYAAYLFKDSLVYVMDLPLSGKIRNMDGMWYTGAIVLGDKVRYAHYNIENKSLYLQDPDTLVFMGKNLNNEYQPTLFDMRFDDIEKLFRVLLKQYKKGKQVLTAL